MTEVRLPAPVPATPVDDAFEHGRFGEKGEIAGAFSFDQAKPGAGFWGHILFTCPCGCGSFSRLPVGLNEKPPHGIDPDGIKATWRWDGNRTRPTLDPSIHHVGHWHGWLKNGVWVQA